MSLFMCRMFISKLLPLYLEVSLVVVSDSSIYL